MTCCKRMSNARCCFNAPDCEINRAFDALQASDQTLLAWFYVFDGYLRSYSFTGIGDAWSVQVPSNTGRWHGGLVYHYGIDGDGKPAKPHYPVPALLP